MRIIAGSLGGRRINAPQGNVTHPMSERIRGALFNSLGDLSGLSVLDAFGGTGAIGIEAYSRGSSHVVIVERDSAIFKLLKSNLTALGVQDKIQCSRTNIRSWASRNKTQRFDVIICDPPFHKRQDETVIRLVKLLSDKGVLVVSQSSLLDPIEIDQMKIIKEKSYGDAVLYYYSR